MKKKAVIESEKKSELIDASCIFFCIWFCGVLLGFFSDLCFVALLVCFLFESIVLLAKMLMSNIYVC